MNELAVNESIMTSDVKRRFVSKLMNENSVSAFAIKGNETKYSQEGKICVDYAVLFNQSMRIVVLTEGEGPFGAELSNFCSQRIIACFQERLKHDNSHRDIKLAIKLAFDDLQRELARDDPRRPFDCVLSGAAVLFTLLKANASRDSMDFYTASVGPLTCLLIDKR